MTAEEIDARAISIMEADGYRTDTWERFNDAMRESYRMRALKDAALFDAHAILKSLATAPPAIIESICEPSVLAMALQKIADCQKSTR